MTQVTDAGILRKANQMVPGGCEVLRVEEAGFQETELSKRRLVRVYFDQAGVEKSFTMKAFYIPRGDYDSRGRIQEQLNGPETVQQVRETTEVRACVQSEGHRDTAEESPAVDPETSTEATELRAAQQHPE